MQKLKKVLIIVTWIALCGGLVVLLAFVKDEQQYQRCKSFEVSIDYRQADCFITTEEIKSMVYKTGNPVKGRLLTTINLENLKRIIAGNPYVAKVNVYSTIEGSVRVNLVQREPVVRIVNRFGQSYYIDQEGFMMPTQPGFSARVLIINGNIDQAYSTRVRLDTAFPDNPEKLDSLSTINKLYLLARYISRHNNLDALIEQAYLNNEGDIELITRLTDHLIIFGDIDDMAVKFENLEAFYKYGLNRIGWDKYNLINLKYTNQVVCLKTK